MFLSMKGILIRFYLKIALVKVFPSSIFVPGGTRAEKFALPENLKPFYGGKA